jgi:diguanylate cyclase (GGDEF)-like protein
MAVSPEPDNSPSPLKFEANSSIMSRLHFGLQSGSAVSTALVNSDLTIAWVSGSIIDLLGRSAAELVGTGALDLLHPEDAQLVIALISSELDQPTNYRERQDPARIVLNRLRFKHPKKQWVEVEMSASNETANPRVRGFVLHFVPCQVRATQDAVMVAMLERKSTYEIVSLIADVVGEVIEDADIFVQADDSTICTSDRLLHVVNRLTETNSKTTTGTNTEESVEHDYTVWRLPAVLDGTSVGAIAVGVGLAMPLTMWTRTVLQQLTVLVCHLVRRDQMERKLSLEASCDPLTGLANRRTFFRRTEHAAASPHAVIYVDMDGFKTINDAFGHEIGDAALIEVGHRITNAVRPEDLVSRFGGDEFTVWCAVEDEQEAVHVAERIRSRLIEDPFQVNDIRIDLRATIGVAVGEAGEVDSLLRRADLAMIGQKRNIKGIVVLDRIDEP